MTVLVLLSGGWDAESECWGQGFTFKLGGPKKKKSVMYFLLLQPAPNFQFTLIAVGTAVLAAVHFNY